MNKITKYFFTSIILLTCVSISHSLSINVDGDSRVLDTSKASENVNTVSLPKIAYIDMENVFNEHPLSSRSKEEFTIEVEKRKNELLNFENELLKLQADLKVKEGEIKDSQDKIDLLKTESSATINKSTTSLLSSDKMTELIKSTDEDVKIKQMEYNAISVNIEKKRADIEERNKNNKNELSVLEESKSAEVLKDIFEIINKIAQEDGILMIIDKNDVLYSQPYQDITKKVLDRMRGR